MPFPLPQRQLFRFRVGGREHILVIPALRLELRPKRAEVIPIPTPSCEAEPLLGTESRWNLHSASAGVMNVLTTMDVARRSEMKTFTIDSENKVGTEAEQSTAPGTKQFSSREEFAELTQDWPLVRLVAMWNGLPGVTAVTRFTDRKTAVTRIWKTLQSPAGKANGSAHSAKRIGIRGKKSLAREGSKKARILTLLKQPKGASLHEIMHATGWQAHSVRGFISGNLVKRMGLKVNSTRRSGGERSYQLMRG